MAEQRKMGMAITSSLTGVMPSNYIELKNLADIVAKSGLYQNWNTPQKAFTMFQLCASWGIQPIQAVTMFDIIQGRPGLNARTLQALFQKAGGIIEFHRHDFKGVKATFIHPNGRTKLTTEFTVEDAQRIIDVKSNKALFEKNTWQNYPEDMCHARCIARGVRGTMPEVMMGFYTREEIEDDPKLVQATVRDVTAEPLTQETEFVEPPKSDEPVVVQAKAIKKITPEKAKAKTPDPEPDPEPKSETPGLSKPRLASKAQAGMAFALAKELGYSSDTLRDHIHQTYGCSTTELTMSQAKGLIDYLQDEQANRPADTTPLQADETASQPTKRYEPPDDGTPIKRGTKKPPESPENALF